MKKSLELVEMGDSAGIRSSGVTLPEGRSFESLGFADAGEADGLRTVGGIVSERQGAGLAARSGGGEAETDRTSGTGGQADAVGAGGGRAKDRKLSRDADAAQDQVRGAGCRVAKRDAGRGAGLMNHDRPEVNRGLRESRR